MDINLTLLKGRLAVPPLVEYDADGSVRARMLVLVRSEQRYRFDVLPVVSSGPEAALLDESVVPGAAVYVAGALMRRCTPGLSGRLEVVADFIEFPDSDRRPPAR